MLYDISSHSMRRCEEARDTEPGSKNLLEEAGDIFFLAL